MTYNQKRDDQFALGLFGSLAIFISIIAAFIAHDAPENSGFEAAMTLVFIFSFLTSIFCAIKALRD